MFIELKLSFILLMKKINQITLVLNKKKVAGTISDYRKHLKIYT